MRYPKALQNLIEKFSELPSVGPKTAERYVFHLWRQNPEKLQSWATALGALKTQTKLCTSCGVISESDPCSICADQNRSAQTVCVVENTQDLITLEATKQHQGKYFVLNGLLNTLDDIKPSDLNLQPLVDRVKAHQIKELILALNFTVEGETTALYLNKLFKDHLKITRLAKGLPAGSNLEYADETTLVNALKYRSEIK